MRLLWLLCVAMVMLLSASDRAVAQSPQFVPAYPLYCRGPLTTDVTAPGQSSTPFRWAATGAGAADPGAGECAWADRPASGNEVSAQGTNVICDFSQSMKSVAADTYVEVGVARDPLVNNCMHLARYIGSVSPPFSPVPALAPFTRQSIANLSPAQIASLRRGIEVMMSRADGDPTSFRFQANIHGTYDSATLPAEMQAWNQCEHGSFYFLSWHRMYLYFFDRILRAASGDSELVLPYWNWGDPAQRTLPVPFRLPADSSNSLFIASPGRPSALNAGTGSIGAGAVDMTAAFADVQFESPAGSGHSFGGQVATPMQFSSPHGDLESQPHDVVHVALGGLMGDPSTAARDPIFWLHHANIDRLWNRWIDTGGGRADPGDAAWLNTQFTFFDEAGHAIYLTGAEVVESAHQLNYQYDDDVSPPNPQRSKRPEEARALSDARVEGLQRQVEIKLFSQTRLAKLGGAAAKFALNFTPQSKNRLREFLKDDPRTKIFLRFDDVHVERATGVYYEVYLDSPPNQKPDIHAPGFIGNLSFFGLNPHKMPGHTSAVAPSAFVEYDVSAKVREALARGKLSVMLVPRGLFSADGEPLPVASEVQGTVGGVSLVAR